MIADRPGKEVRKRPLRGLLSVLGPPTPKAKSYHLSPLSRAASSASAKPTADSACALGESAPYERSTINPNPWLIDFSRNLAYSSYATQTSMFFRDHRRAPVDEIRPRDRGRTLFRCVKSWTVLNAVLGRSLIAKPDPISNTISDHLETPLETPWPNLAAQEADLSS